MNRNKTCIVLLLLLILAMPSPHNRIFCMVEVLPVQADVLRWGRTIQTAFGERLSGARDSLTLQQRKLKENYLDKRSIQLELQELGVAPRVPIADEPERIRALYEALRDGLQRTLGAEPRTIQEADDALAEMDRQLLASMKNPALAEEVAIRQGHLREQLATTTGNIRLFGEALTRSQGEVARVLTVATLPDTLTAVQRALITAQGIKAQRALLVELSRHCTFLPSYETFRTNVLRILTLPPQPEDFIEEGDERPPQPPRTREEALQRLAEVREVVGTKLGRLPLSIQSWPGSLRALTTILGHRPEPADLTQERLKVLEDTHKTTSKRTAQLQTIYDITLQRLATLGHQVLNSFAPNDSIVLTKALVSEMLHDDGIALEDIDPLLTFTPEEIARRIQERKDALLAKINEFLDTLKFTITLQEERFEVAAHWEALRWVDRHENVIAAEEKNTSYLELLSKLTSANNQDKKLAKRILYNILSRIRIRTAGGHIDLPNNTRDNQLECSIVARFFVMSLCFHIKDQFEKTISPSLNQFLDEARTYLAVLLLTNDPTSKTQQNASCVKAVRAVLAAQDVVLGKATPIKTTACASYIRAFPTNEYPKFHISEANPHDPYTPYIESPFPGNYTTNTWPTIQLNYQSQIFKAPGGAYFLARNLLTLLDRDGVIVNDDLLTTIEHFNLLQLCTQPLASVRMPDSPGIDASGLTRNFFAQIYGTFFGKKTPPDDIDYERLPPDLKEGLEPNITQVIKLLSLKEDATKTDREFEDTVTTMPIDEQKDAFAKMLHKNHLFPYIGGEYRYTGGPRDGVRANFNPSGLMPDHPSIGNKYGYPTQDAQRRLSTAYRALGRVYFLSLAQSRPMPSLAAHLVYLALERTFDSHHLRLGTMLECSLRHDPASLMKRFGEISGFLRLLSQHLLSQEKTFDWNTDDRWKLIDEATRGRLSTLKTQRNLIVFKQVFLTYLKTCIQQQIIGFKYNRTLEDINAGFWEPRTTQALQARGDLQRQKNEFRDLGLDFFKKINRHLHQAAPLERFVDEDYATYSTYIPLNSVFIRNSPEVTLLLMQEFIGFLSAYDFAALFTPIIDVAIIKGLISYEGIRHPLFEQAMNAYLDANVDNQEELKNFLIFITGAPVPTTQLKINITGGRDNFGHTCYGRWDLGTELINDAVEDLGPHATDEQKIGALKDLIHALTSGDAGYNMG